MNIEMKKEKITAVKCAFDLSAEQGVDIDVNLPDYCLDIKRVLRCFVIPGINSTQVTGDRISAKGDITVRLVYIGEGEKIDSCEQTIELSKYVDVKDMPENPIVLASAKTEYVNCRAASQRRFTVSGNVGVNFKIYTLEEKDICSSAKEDTLETRCESVEAVCSSVMGEKTFDISETVSLDESKKPVGRILRSDAYAKIESLKAVSGKILIKGELVCDVLYCADTKESSLDTVHHSMPISQIIEIASLDDSFGLDVCLEVKNMIVCAKADSSGSNRLLEFASKVSAFIRGTKQGKISYITDCYCTKYESKTQYDNFAFMRPVGKIEKKKSINKTLDLSSQTAKEILDIRSISSVCTSSLNGDRLDINASALLGILFKDEKGKIQYAERNADFDFEQELKEKCEKVVCDPILKVFNLSCTPSGDKVSVKFDCDISGEVFSAVTRHILESVTADEKQEKQKNDAAITVYYCSVGEKIWDIAKRYNTSEKSIREENNLDADTVKEDRMLII